MKTYKFMSILAAAALMAGFASCSSDEPLASDGNDVISDGTTRYMSVQIVNPETGSRADDYTGATTPDYDEKFAAGEDIENNIKSIRFYFFDNDGNPANVRNTASGANYYDIIYSGSAVKPDDGSTPGIFPGGSSPEYPNVNSVVDCDIIISTAEGHKLPSYVIAVCNYKNIESTINAAVTAAEVAGTYTMSTLGKIIFTSSVFSNPTADKVNPSSGDFVMTNSVYVNNGKKIYATKVSAENICATPDAARTNALSVYVERVMAKVDGEFTTTLDTRRKVTGQDVFKAKDSNGNDIKAKLADGTEVEVYVEVLGWNVTATTQLVSLQKWMPTTWTNLNIMGNTSNPVNAPGYYRSYWEYTPFGDGVTPNVSPVNGTYDGGLQYNTFVGAVKNSFSTTTPSGATAPVPVDATYVHPNAATVEASGVHKFTFPATGTHFSDKDNGLTEVIVAAKLVYYDSSNAKQNLDLTNWLGEWYTEANLKIAMANFMKSNIYKRVKTPKGAWTEIEPEDFEFKTVMGGAVVSDSKNRRYAIYPVLTATAKSTYEFTDAATKNAYEKDNTKPETITPEMLNEHLSHAEPAKYYKGGKTYYHFPLRHVGVFNTTANANSPAYYGVVRNHYYKFLIDDIRGLGTPVFDTTETIIPEDPEDQLGYIAAKINVLSWRLVKQTVVLGQ